MKKTTPRRTCARVALVAAALFLNGHAALAAPEDGQKKEDSERIHPMEFVAPEFRGALTHTLEAYQGQAMSFSAETLSAMREGTARMMAAQQPLPSPAVEEVMIPGPEGAPDVKVYVIGAGKGEPRPAILHLHGGGYILGSARDDVPRLQKIADDHDGVIVTVDYRLAPETPFPGPLEDNYAALKWLHDNAETLGVDRSRIAVMGESAGGGHAAMLAIAARDRGEISLNHQILIYPMLDDRTGSTREMPYWMGYGSWTAEANRYGWSSLLGVPAGSDTVPAGSVPARVENLEGLPPTFIGVGSIDLFADEDIEYARRLVNAGVPTELLVVPGGFHGFQFMVPEAESSQRFNAAVDAAISRAFAAPVNADADKNAQEEDS